MIVGALIVTVAGYNWSLATNGEVVDRSAAGPNVLLGLWVIVAPIVFHPGTTAPWNDVIVGVIVASLAGYNAYAASRAKPGSAQPA